MQFNIILLKLGSHCRSDQLDQARPSGRVLVWFGRHEWSGAVGLLPDGYSTVHDHFPIAIRPYTSSCH
ncbi:hypothetical protein DPMN_031066 [Dreissena polymorpha]|uniref:Uncharacterized protein n=1 Tax=Dreissena polymorpha TaxID=45954 RepID=A0A9D4RGZ1_DREPO|nr:hypothetical protein DPMN_031066 [Dreissena polymorpha]